MYVGGGRGGARTGRLSKSISSNTKPEGFASRSASKKPGGGSAPAETPSSARSRAFSPSLNHASKIWSPFHLWRCSRKKASSGATARLSATRFTSRSIFFAR